MKITVEPFDDMWAVYAWSNPKPDTIRIKYLMGKTKNSCDADYAAERLGKGYVDIYETESPETRQAVRDFLTVFLNDPTPVHVEHYAEERQHRLQQVEAAKKAKKKQKNESPA